MNKRETEKTLSDVVREMTAFINCLLRDLKLGRDYEDRAKLHLTVLGQIKIDETLASQLEGIQEDADDRAKEVKP